MLTVWITDEMILSEFIFPFHSHHFFAYSLQAYVAPCFDFEFCFVIDSFQLFGSERLDPVIYEGAESESPRVLSQRKLLSWFPFCNILEENKISVDKSKGENLLMMTLAFTWINYFLGIRLSCFVICLLLSVRHKSITLRRLKTYLGSFLRIRRAFPILCTWEATVEGLIPFVVVRNVWWLF